MTGLILTDVDGTILRWDDGFAAYMQEEHGMPMLSRMRDHYSIARSFGISERDASRFVRDFFLHRLAGELPPEPCAMDVLPKLHARGWRFIAITACPAESVVVDARRHNLEAVFGFPWDVVHCVGLSGEKRSTLLGYRSAIWVEDHFENAVAGSEANHRSFLLDRTFNTGRSHPEVTRVTDWHEIARQISGIGDGNNGTELD